MRLTVHEIEDFLAHWPVARLASQGPDGRPHTVPIVFARVDGVLWSPVDGKPKSGGELARVRNLRARPEASVLLDHYDADWSALWWLRVEVEARVVAPADPTRDPTLAAALAALEAKYPQYRETPVLRDPPILLALRPTAMRGWRASERTGE